MEALKTSTKKRKGWSIWAPHENEIKYFLDMGVSMASTHKIISAKMTKKRGYGSFQKWLHRQAII